VNSTEWVSIEYCGEWIKIDPAASFFVGRDADLVVDENPYLHRRFLELANHNDLWWLRNVGGQLSATLSDAEGRLQAWLSPGGQLPLVFGSTVVRFTAGPTTYELTVHLPAVLYSAPAIEAANSGTTTVGALSLTVEQRQLLVALAEPALRRESGAAFIVPSSSHAAARLGWSLTKYNRKLDNLCQKLERSGVTGLHGDIGSLASGRRSRLVEYALAVRLVTAADIAVLDGEPTGKP
jgi:hypothetical protein